MRSNRLSLLLFAIYLVFIGGSAYYNLFFPVRVLHHVIVTATLAIWLLRRIRRGQGLPQTPLNRPLYAAFGVWVLSAALSDDPRMALEHIWFPLTHALFFFGLAEFVQRGRQRQLFEIQFFLGALVVIVTAAELASWYFGLGFLPGTHIGWADVIGPGLWFPLEVLRVSLALNISTLLAGYVAPLVLVTAAWALTADRRYRAALFVLAVLLLVVLALTMSRGGYLSLAAGVGLLVVLRATASAQVTRRLSPRLLLIAAVLAIAAAGVAFVIVSTSAGRTGGDLGRLDLWRSAVRMVSARPVTGVGPGLFGAAFRVERNPLIVQDKLATAHNVYLNTAAETGLLGVAVGLWLGVAFIRGWWQQRQAAQGGRQFRLDACFAALVGLSVHSLVDAFTVTPILLVIALLAAYCVVRSRVGFELPPSDRRMTAVVALGILLVYGGWLLWLDAAQVRYQASFGGGEAALEAARDAARIDPALRLYHLHAAYLEAQTVPLDEARALYEAALQLDPTWDVGWLNLAALAESSGDIDAALAALERARVLNARSSAALHWARLAEAHNVATDDAIMTAYEEAIGVPLSSWWWQTALRRAAVEAWMADAPVDYQYRVLSVHQPDRLNALVPDSPVMASEWWVVGQWRLEQGDTASAETAFSEAIALEPRRGDFYASRARSRVATDPDGARRDLDIADLLGTQFESTNAIRAGLTGDLEEKQRLWAAALSPRTVTQEFAQVVYGRPAVFDIVPQMRAPGPGSAALAPWYALAQSYADAGDMDAAANVYRAILDLAPEEITAKEASTASSR